MSRQRAQTLEELNRLNHHKKPATVGEPLGEEMIDFFKQSVARRQMRLVKMSEYWSQLVPPLLSDHCALESFHRGTLTVLVDSSSHLYELKQLLLAGTEEQLLVACKSTGLRKISLKPGRWYVGDSASDRRPRFSSRD